MNCSAVRVVTGEIQIDKNKDSNRRIQAKKITNNGGRR
jgi:hypothetical protein